MHLALNYSFYTTHMSSSFICQLISINHFYTSLFLWINNQLPIGVELCYWYYSQESCTTLDASGDLGQRLPAKKTNHVIFCYTKLTNFLLALNSPFITTHRIVEQPWMPPSISVKDFWLAKKTNHVIFCYTKLTNFLLALNSPFDTTHRRVAQHWTPAAI